MASNPELELAYQFITQTNKNVFLTGKAGTGKTTFLKTIKKEVNKRMAVIAPTGVAAINAEGVTIHSLFQLPFGPIVPGMPMKEKRKFSRQKIQLIKGIELLIIDEISMVRADVLDAIDQVMRRYKNAYRNFGGAQVLMIGDLHQLPPVVNTSEWTLLQSHFSTPYFFGSNALKASNPVVIQLKKIYRQSDEDFIGILNQVRQGKISQTLLEQLNTRYRKDVESFRNEGYITLASHNAKADKINLDRLQGINEKEQRFNARIEGTFPESSYPTEEHLVLKKGAQVMFVKNDSNDEKRYFNGKIATVSAFKSDGVEVEDESGKKIIVKEEQWENRRYSLDEKSKELKEEVVGSFIQLPLKLAWAITIHKSQGLTFDKLIIDAEAAFAHGQVYVALSRCTHFKGIILSSKLRISSVKTDEVVNSYVQESLDNAPNEKELRKAQKEFQEELLSEFFSFSTLKSLLGKLNRLVHVNARSLPEGTLEEVKVGSDEGQNKVIAVGERFCRELNAAFEIDTLPENSEALKERCKKAVGYFSREVKELESALDQLDFTTDNKELKGKLEELLNDFSLEFLKNKKAFEHLEKGLDTEVFLREQSNIEIDFVPGGKKKKSQLPKDVLYPALYAKLVDWRKHKAKETGKPAFTIFHTKTLIAIVNTLPEDPVSLSEIPGLGKVKVGKYGEELMDIIHTYLANRKIFDGYLEENQSAREKKKDTYKESYDLYRSGLSVPEIAVKRKLTEQTIHGHLARFVGEKKLDLKEVMNAEDAKEIVRYFSQTEDDTLNTAKNYFGERFEFFELNYAREFWRGVSTNK